MQSSAAPNTRAARHDRTPSARRARESLIARHRPLALHLARRYSGRGEPLEDLQQVALMALVKAVDRFDENQDVKFATYASRVITGELKRYFRDHAWRLHIPRSLQERWLAVKLAVETLQVRHQRTPTVPEVAAYLRLDEDAVLEAMEVGRSHRMASLDATPDDRDGGPAAAVDDPGLLAVESRVARRQVLERLLGALDGEDRSVLEAYYLEGLSQKEIAERMGTSQVAVSRRLARIRSRLHASATVLAGDGLNSVARLQQ